MSAVRHNIRIVREKIADAAARSGRNPQDIKLMAVTKSVGDDRILEAIENGIDILGENYVQEAKRKIDKMGRAPEWHMIGYLQSNKAKYAVRLFDMIHSVDRMTLALELDRRSALADRVTPILLEVNLSGEETKSGTGKEEVLKLAKEISPLKNLSVKGLMTMAPWFDDPEDARPYFRELKRLRDRIAGENLMNVEMRELSMGMTADFEVAVEEGATIVRIGRAIFGSRPS